MSVVKLLLFFLISSTSESSALLIRSNDVYEGLIKSIYDYSYCRSITFIYASSPHQTTSLGLEMETKLMALHLFFSRKLYIQTSMIDIRKFPLQINKNIDKMTNPLFIILNDLNDIQSLLATTIFTPSASLSLRSTWLIFFRDVTTVEKFFGNFSIPLNCEVLIAIRNVDEPKSELLTEVYQLGNKSKYQVYGSWNVNTGLIPPKLSFLQRRTNLEGLPLRVAISPLPMFSRDNSIYAENLIFSEMLKLLSEMMNFTRIIKRRDSVGYCVSDTECVGIMSDLVNKNIDIYFSPISLSNDRLKYIDMSMNLLSSELHLFVKKPGQKSSWEHYFKPFAFEIWIAISIVVLLSSVILFIMEMIYSSDDELRSWTRLKLKTPSFLNCIFKVFGILCGKEIGKSRSTPMRTIQVTMQMTSILIITSYAAKLIQSLTTGISVVAPFSSVDDFLNDKTWELGIPIWSSRLSNVSNPTKKPSLYLNDKILHEPLLLATETEGLIQLCYSHKRGFLSYERLPKRLNLPDNCEILSIGRVLVEHYSVGLQKRSPFREIIHFQLLRINDYGFFKRSFISKSKTMKTKLTNNWIPVQFSHVYPIIIFLIIMIILSLILLYGEIMLDDRIKKVKHEMMKSSRRLRNFT